VLLTKSVQQEIRAVESGKPPAMQSLTPLSSKRHHKEQNLVEPLKQAARPGEPSPAITEMVWDLVLRENSKF